MAQIGQAETFAAATEKQNLDKYEDLDDDWSEKSEYDMQVQ